MPLAPARIVAADADLIARRKLMRRSNWWAMFSATGLACKSVFDFFNVDADWRLVDGGNLVLKLCNAGAARTNPLTRP